MSGAAKRLGAEARRTSLLTSEALTNEPCLLLHVSKKLVRRAPVENRLHDGFKVSKWRAYHRG